MKGMTDTRKDLVIEQWHLFPISFWAQCSDRVCRLHRLPFSVLGRFAPMSLFVCQLMSYSPCKKKNGRKRRVKGKERTKCWTENCGSERGSETSYRYESATGCQPARLRASRMFLFILRFSLLHSHRALSPAIPFFFRHFRTGFSLYFCHFPPWHSPKCIRSVEAPLMDSILY